MTTTTDLAKLRAEYLELEARRTDIVDRQEAIKALVAELGAGRHQAGDGLISVTQQHRFDKARAEQVLPADMLALITVSTIDPAQARKVLPPAVYEACSVTLDKPRISFR